MRIELIRVNLAWDNAHRRQTCYNKKQDSLKTSTIILMNVFSITNVKSLGMVKQIILLEKESKS